MENIAQVIELFFKTAKSTTSAFQVSKIGSYPSRKRGLESLEVKSVKSSVSEDLTLILEPSIIGMKSQDQIVYSIHCADINGLSQLENYLLAHSISEFLSTNSSYAYE